MGKCTLHERILLLQLHAYSIFGITGCFMHRTHCNRGNQRAIYYNAPGLIELDPISSQANHLNSAFEFYLSFVPYLHAFTHHVKLTENPDWQKLFDHSPKEYFSFPLNQQGSFMNFEKNYHLKNSDTASYLSESVSLQRYKASEFLLTYVYQNCLQNVTLILTRLETLLKLCGYSSKEPKSTNWIRGRLTKIPCSLLRSPFVFRRAHLFPSLRCQGLCRLLRLFKL